MPSAGMLITYEFLNRAGRMFFVIFVLIGTSVQVAIDPKIIHTVS